MRRVLKAIGNLLILVPLLGFAFGLALADPMDIWNPGGSLYWLRSGDTPPSTVTTIYEGSQYSSDLGGVLDSSSYVNATSVGYDSGVYVDTDSFINQGYIRTTGDDVQGILLDSDRLFTSIENYGAIYVLDDGSNEFWDGYLVGIDGGYETYGTYVGSFLNKGHILVEVGFPNPITNELVGDTYQWIGDVYGAYLDGVGNFTNEGSIVANIRMGDVIEEFESYDVYGVYLNQGAENFDNKGTIAAFVTTGNVYGTDEPYIWIYDVYGVYSGGGIGSITNSGNIYVNVKIGDARGFAYYEEDTISVSDIYGFYVYGDVGNFLNTGNIQVGVSIGNNLAAEDNYLEIYDVYGVYVDGRVDNFLNKGSILVSVKGGNGGFAGEETYSDVYIYDIYGVYLSDAGTFTNNGTIEVLGSLGDAVGYWTYVYYMDVSGVYLESAEAVENNGNIRVPLSAGNAVGEGSWVYAMYVSGLLIDSDVNSFVNRGNIITQINLGNATGDYSWVSAYSISGVEIWGNVGSFVNSGDIRVNVKVGDANGTSSFVTTYDPDSNAGVYGVYIGNNVDVGSIENSGTIQASVTAGSANGEGSVIWAGHVLGVDIGSDDYGNSVNIVSNTGTISASVVAGNANGEGASLYAFTANAFWVDFSTVNNFENRGTLFASISVGNATGTNSYIGIGDVVGAGFLGNVGNFTNYKNIYALVSAGNITGQGAGMEIGWWIRPTYRDYSIGPVWYGVEGVYFGGDVSSFTNYGNIISQVSVGDVRGDNAELYIGSVFGVDSTVLDTIDRFYNKGTIASSVSVGEIAGEGAYLYIGAEGGPISGVYLNTVNNFDNEGKILGSFNLGKVSGNNADVEIYDVYGLAVYQGGVRSFVNEKGGLISAQVKTGDVTGENASLYIEDVVGANLNRPQDIQNRGTISAVVSAGKGSEAEYIAALAVNNMNGNLSNEGNLVVSVSADTVDSVAGIRIYGSSVTLSNPGLILVEIPRAKTIGNVRTLWIENSEVTLSEKFAILFGAPGIDPSPDSSTNVNLRPIYVDSSSTLNLNNASLLARIDSRNLKFNTPYYLIHNDGGTIQNEFGNLVKMWSNPEVVAYWAGADKGENAAVEFGYVPGKNSLAGAMGGTASSIVAGMMSGLLGGSLPWTSPFFFTKEKEKVMLASAAATPVITSPGYKDGFFVMPFYTRVNADDLNFDANAYGFVLGVGGKLHPDLTATLYGGYSYVDLDFKKVKGPEGEKQDLWIGGVNLNYFRKPWVVRFSGTVHKANHDYDGRTGANYEFKEKADYNSWGVDTELTVGYLVERGKFSVLPEMGLGYTYYEADNFHTKVSANSAWNRYYRPGSVDFFKGIVGVMGRYRSDERLVLSGALRVEQAFGENDVSVISYLTGLPRYRLKQDISDTTVVGQVGLSYRLKKNTYFDLNVRGDFNSDYQAYTGKAMLRINF